LCVCVCVCVCVRVRLCGSARVRSLVGLLGRRGNGADKMTFSHENVVAGSRGHDLPGESLGN
jgi:hypothetical protein